MLRSDGRMDSELEQRIGATSKIIGAIGMAVIGKRELSQKTKMRIVNTMVIPALTYGCETWVLLRSQKSKNQATEMKVLRRVLGVTTMDRLKNEEIGKKLQQVGVLEKVKRRQLSNHFTNIRLFAVIAFTISISPWSFSNVTVPI